MASTSAAGCSTGSGHRAPSSSPSTNAGGTQKPSRTRFGQIKIHVEMLNQAQTPNENTGVKRRVILGSIPTEPVKSDDDGGGIFNETEEGSVYLPGENEPEFSAEKLSLDDIIRLRKFKADMVIIPDLGKSGKLRRADVHEDDDPPMKLRSIKDPNEQKMSPITVLRILSEGQKLIEMEAKELIDLSKRNFRAHRWRVIWSHDDIIGIGEAPRKLMASQVAALDLVEKLRLFRKTYKLPECAIPQGCMINPFVFTLLEQGCNDLGFMSPEFELRLYINQLGRKMFRCICYIQDFVFIADSFDGNYAKRLAARAAYQAFVEKDFPDDEIIRGDMCFEDSGYEDSDFLKIESEANHVYMAHEKKYAPDNICITFPNRKSIGLYTIPEEPETQTENTRKRHLTLVPPATFRTPRVEAKRPRHYSEPMEVENVVEVWTTVETEEPIKQAQIATEEPIKQAQVATEEPIKQAQVATEEHIKQSKAPMEEPSKQANVPTEKPINEAKVSTEVPIKQAKVPLELPIQQGDDKVKGPTRRENVAVGMHIQQESIPVPVVEFSAMTVEEQQHLVNEEQQRLVNEEQQRLVNEQQRLLNEQQRLLNEEQQRMANEIIFVEDPMNYDDLNDSHPEPANVTYESKTADEVLAIYFQMQERNRLREMK